MEHPRHYGTGSRHDPTVVVFLSLYLLLLAFFVLLNSISQQVATRAEDAMGSVNSTFNRQLPLDTVEQSNALHDSRFAGADSFYRRLRALFAETLPTAVLAWDDRAGALRATFPSEALFVPGQAVVRSSAAALMNGIADSLAATRPGVRFESELLIASGRVLPPHQARETTLALHRAGHYARDLRALGAPATAVLAGLGEGEPGTLRLSFYARDPERARLTFDRPARVQ